MRKISLYKFVTTFCIVPVNDWTALAQRIFIFITKIYIVHVIWKIITSKPFYLAGLIFLLTYSPDSVAWIFIKIGEIEMKVFAILLRVVMPQIFDVGGGVYSSWGEIWAAGINSLPTTMVEVLNGLGISQLLGMVTGTIGACSTIRIYRKVMSRGGLM